MKKFITMLLVCVMVLGLFAGCGNGSTQQTTAATTAAPAADATEAPAQETEAAPDKSWRPPSPETIWKI